MNLLVESALCIISFIILVSTICLWCVTWVPLATAERVRHSAAAFCLTWHLGAIWRPGSGNTQSWGGWTSGQRSTRRFQKTFDLLDLSSGYRRGPLWWCHHHVSQSKGGAIPGAEPGTGAELLLSYSLKAPPTAKTWLDTGSDVRGQSEPKKQHISYSERVSITDKSTNVHNNWTFRCSS